MKMILETPRLLLREMSMDDLDFVAALVGSPEVMRYYPQVLDRAGAEDSLRLNLARYEQTGVGFWLVLLKETQQPVGQVGLIRQLVEGEHEMEIGYRIHHPYWRRGYASEAAAGVRDHAFGRRGLDHVISLIRPINKPSQGVARKVGMRPGKFVLHGGLEHIVFRIDRTPPT
jgi:RimJ/RimL family protein N-acetyltransferase